MARTSRGSFRGTYPRRRKAWEEGPGGTASTNYSGSSAQIVGAGANIIVDGLTLLRTRGEFEIFMTAATAIPDGFRGAFGIGIVTTAAFTAGVASIPTPIAEQDWDGWLFWRAFGVHAGLQPNSDGSGYLRFEVDSKAMRKLDLLETIVAVVEVVEVGTATATSHFDSRVLLALP